MRDLRVRWALEEAGLPYEERLLTREEQHSAPYRNLQPFNQVPSYEEDDPVMFESGTIVLHIAVQSEALCPPDAIGKTRMTSWVFAALNSLEPPTQNLTSIDLSMPTSNGHNCGVPAPSRPWWRACSSCPNA